eukprot:scaffold4223_cov189-Amphora_coffeaeformis.AAC.67
MSFIRTTNDNEREEEDTHQPAPSPSWRRAAIVWYLSFPVLVVPRFHLSSQSHTLVVTTMYPSPTTRSCCYGQNITVLPAVLQYKDECPRALSPSIAAPTELSQAVAEYEYGTVRVL